MTIKEAVAGLLAVNPKTRDDDPYLYIEVVRLLWKLWEQGNVYAMLKAVDYQSVRATRQNLQMKHPDLRGESYKDRQRRSAKKRKEYSPTYLDKLSMWWNTI